MGVAVRGRKGTIRDGGEVELEVERSALRFAWRLRHRDHREGGGFTDEQVEGPFRSWVHVHCFEDDGEGGTRVLDEITWEAPAIGALKGLVTSLLERELGRVFAFRERRLRGDLADHARWAERPRLTVAVTGASGLIGRALTRFLTSGGHRVVPLVRSREAAGRVPGAVFWDPARGEIDAEGLRGADAVVHLAGETLVQLPRWTEEKKRRIRESRVQGTELIARAMAGMHEGGPTTLVAASGITYYGDRGEEVLRETSTSGRGFLADVTRAWEEATRRVSGAGIRVVNLRMGPAMSPAGGMLEKVLLPFRMGLGGRLGSGRQYVPWIDLDDVTGAILHALMEERLSGAVNVCAPGPVTNAAFADVLGRVLGRPTLVPIPSLVVKASLGQMGEEVLLYGQRARPVRLLETGYRFRFETLEESLRHQLGRGVGDPGEGREETG
jgi:uncharacterized protein (TIGR01777 family)